MFQFQLYLTQSFNSSQTVGQIPRTHQSEQADEKTAGF